MSFNPRSHTEQHLPLPPTTCGGYPPTTWGGYLPAVNRLVYLWMGPPSPPKISWKRDNIQHPYTKKTTTGDEQIHLSATQNWAMWKDEEEMFPTRRRNNVDEQTPFLVVAKHTTCSGMSPHSCASCVPLGGHDATASSPLANCIYVMTLLSLTRSAITYHDISRSAITYHRLPRHITVRACIFLTRVFTCLATAPPSPPLFLNPGPLVLFHMLLSVDISGVKDADPISFLPITWGSHGRGAWKGHGVTLSNSLKEAVGLDPLPGSNSLRLHG